ncbi:NUDIX domain protein [compost metagenome]
MEDEESREECLRRECAEELGYDIGIGAYIGSAIQYMPTLMTWEPLQVTGYFYKAILLGPNGNQSEPDHTLEWLPAEEAVYNMYTAFSRWAIRLCYDKAIVY